MPHADVRAERLGGAVDEPVEVSGTDFGFEHILPQRKLDSVIRCADAGDVDLAPVDKPRAALAYGVAVYALVPPDDLAAEDEISRRRQLRSARYPADIVLVGDEAYLHAVRLVRDRQAEFLGQRAHLLFLEAAEREHRAAHLLAA